MSAPQPTAHLENVSVTYRSFDDPRVGLRQYLSRSAGRNRRFTDVHAVRDVSLTLYEGETVGVVGRNGSGKSTLLTAMTGLLPIDKGRIRVLSRPRLLGVGAALRGSVSGRRNIVIGALALGISQREIESRLDEIIEFVDIGEAIDRPMRTYSSGQRARLNFAIATISTPDILLVDEALVVGDAAFTNRARDRISAIRAAAGTVVLVTHNLLEITATCDRAFWLDEGEIRMDGFAPDVVEAYESSVLA